MTSIRRLLHTVNQHKSTIYKVTPQASKQNYIDRVYIVPNVVKLSRLAAAPAMGYFILNGMQSQAIACFAIAAISDIADDWLAYKHRHDRGDIDCILNPILDKIFLGTCYISLCKTGVLPLLLVKTVILRDITIVSIGAANRYFGLNEEKRTFRRFLDFKNYPTIGLDPTYLSKLNTVLQYLLIGTHLTTSHLSGSFTYDWVMFGFQAIVYNTTFISGYLYFMQATNTGFFNKPPNTRSF